MSSLEQQKNLKATLHPWFWYIEKHLSSVFPLFQEYFIEFYSLYFCYKDTFSKYKIML